ncbi:hypothetical protein N9P68_00240 [Pseudomonadales bacterium]|nr:hypothetical protein [Pseudomonadales bacterium]
MKLASFSSVRYFSYFILMLRGFLVASILGPEAFGLYSIVIILQQQFSLFGLGVRESVSLELANSSSDDERFAEISVTAFWFTVSVIVVLNIISGIISELDNILGYETYNLHMALKLAAFTIGTEILTNIARARGMLVTVMVGEFGYATLSLFIFWAVSYTFLLAGAFLYALLVSNIIVFCYYVIMHRDLFSTASFSFADAKQLVALGIPILIQNTGAVFLYSAGHYYLSISAYVEQLSIYSFAFSLAIAAQIGVQSVLWAKFSEMLSLFGSNDSSVAARKRVATFVAQVTKASQAFLILSVIALKLFLVFFVSNFFPEFVLAVPIVVVIFMALYWPILAISEATFLLAKKQFRKLYMSSGIAIFVMATLMITYYLYEDIFDEFGHGYITAFVVCSANFIFYCMLKLYGGPGLGRTITETLLDIIKTISLLSILAICYYYEGLVFPVFIMVFSLLLLLAGRNLLRRVIMWR